VRAPLARTAKQQGSASARMQTDNGGQCQYGQQAQTDRLTTERVACIDGRVSCLHAAVTAR